MEMAVDSFDVKSAMRFHHTKGTFKQTSKMAEGVGAVGFHAELSLRRNHKL